MNKKILDYTISLMESSTPERPAWNAELLMGHVDFKWNYVDGCMMKAILDIYEATGDKKYLNFVDEFVSYYVSEDGKILGYDKEEYNSDHINGGKVLFPLYFITGKEKYKRAIENLHSQLLTHPRTPAGNFWHKKIYPNQVWLDGLYMTLPFLAEYETRFNQSHGIKDIVKQFTNVYNSMRDEASGLLFHGYDETKEAFWADATTGLSKNFWSRSLGWYIMALVDTAVQIDEQQFDERETLIRYLKEVSDALIKASDPKTGMLWQVTSEQGREGNYLETSSSSALAYALMKGARLGFLPEFYIDKGKKVFNSIVEQKLKTSDDKLPVLTDVCLVAGLGVYSGKGDYELRDGTYEYYVSEPRVENDAKGTAPFLMAFAEIIREGGSLE